jgi:hypothetical protein
VSYSVVSAEGSTPAVAVNTNGLPTVVLGEGLFTVTAANAGAAPASIAKKYKEWNFMRRNFHFF